MTSEFPGEGEELTHILVVSDMDRSRAFYRDVLGAAVYRQYGATLQFQASWLLLVAGGGPTDDKPSVTFVPPAEPDAVSDSMAIRVPTSRSLPPHPRCNIMSP